MYVKEKVIPVARAFPLKIKGHGLRRKFCVTVLFIIHARVDCAANVGAEERKRRPEVCVEDGELEEQDQYPSHQKTDATALLAAPIAAAAVHSL